MSVAIAAARAGLAVVLIAAGAAKLADVRGFVGTLAAFGVEPRRGHSLTLALAACELGVGLASLVYAYPPATDPAVLLLTLVFLGTVLLAYRRGISVRCRCFGALAREQFGRRALVRSIVLTAAAVVVVVGGLVDRSHPSFVVWKPVLLVAGLVFALAASQAARAVEIAQEG